jgi:hypothetical protein
MMNTGTVIKKIVVAIHGGGFAKENKRIMSAFTGKPVK